MDKENKVVASFQSLRSGMGNFMFKTTVLKGDLYTAVVKLADTTITCKLPTVYTHGVVMQLENINEAQLQLTVIPIWRLAMRWCFMLAQSRNLVKDFQQKTFSNGTCILWSIKVSSQMGKIS